MTTINTFRLDASARLYQTRFDGDDWSGGLIARPITADGAVGSPSWDAAEQIPESGSRNLWTYDSDAVSGDARGIPFLWDSLTSEQRAHLNTDGIGTPDPVGGQKGAERLGYLRGQRDNEQRNGGAFRNRNTPLGDIAHSQPCWVGNMDYGYQVLPGSEGASYAAFRDRNHTPMIYVGANDGMLHGFDARTGAEAFAYVPNGVFQYISRLTAVDYGHVYLVDGSPWVGDVYLDGQWRRVLVSGQGRGGRTVFALDVSDPAHFAAGHVLWEFNDPDLGYTLPQAGIARLPDGQWAAIFGNGYDSDNHRAVLFIVNLASGSALKISTGSGDYPNGLGTPLAVDSDGDRIADVVYAGDLRGNLWKFDLSAADSGSWHVAFSGAPLMTAIDPDGASQPITVRPEAGRHPQGGIMVYFGTGKYFATGDEDDRQVQSLYGIRDNGSPVTLSLLGRGGALEAQPTIRESSAFGWRLTANNTVDWNSRQGWYMDLVVAGNARGERVISAPRLRFGRILFMTRVPPTGESAGAGWLMELNAVTGGRPAEPAIDLNDDGRLTPEDRVTVGDSGSESVPVSGVKVGGSVAPTLLSAGSVDYRYISEADGAVAKRTARGVEYGRGSWRQLR
jgi:type IV pilus assembly protein PilY1